MNKHTHFPRGWPIGLLLILMAACKDDKAPVPPPPKSAAPTAEGSSAGNQESEPPRQPPEETRPPEIKPLPTPEAYYGKPSLPWLNRPVAFKPMANHSIVLIIVDALNAGHMSTYGYHRNTSPHMDRLVKEGVLFTNYVSNSSWTRPSFTTIITGQPKSVHKMEWDGNSLDRKIVTVAERFKAAGYRTGAVVGNQVIQARWHFDQGFQVYEDVKTLDQIRPRDQRLVNTAISWLKKGGDKPFFLMTFLIDTHAPYRPLKAHRHFLDALPEGEVIRYPYREYTEPLPKDDHNRIVAAYDGEVHSVDFQINRLLEFLQANDKLKNATVIITADHGEAFGHHNCYLHTYHQWESVLRVPFIVISPALDAKGVYDDRPFTHLDIAPTVLDLAGIEYEKGEYPGVSIVEALKDPTSQRDRIVFSQFNAHGVRRQSIRSGPWKLVHHHKVKDRALKQLFALKLYTRKLDKGLWPSLAWDGERYEFYNLAADPKENNDIFAAHQGKTELKALLGALKPYLGDQATEAELTPEMIEALKNIGYIE